MSVRIPTNYSLYIFDLDNTLIQETDYLFQAYEPIAQYLSQKYTLNTTDLYAFLCEEFLAERKGLFDRLFTHYHIPFSELEKCLSILRIVTLKKPLSLNKALYPQIIDLQKIGKKIGVLTNGNVTQQKNKISNIDWQFINHEEIKIVYANDLVPKPDPIGILHIMQYFSQSTANTVFIGDSDTDKQTAKNTNVDFIAFY